MSMSKIKHFFCLERSRTIFSHETIIKCSLSLHHKLIIYYCIVSRQLTNDKLGSCNNKKEKEYKTVKNSRDHWLHICLPESINPWLIVFKGRAHKRSAYIYIYVCSIYFMLNMTQYGYWEIMFSFMLEETIGQWKEKRVKYWELLRCSETLKKLIDFS